MDSAGAGGGNIATPPAFCSCLGGEFHVQSLDEFLAQRGQRLGRCRAKLLDGGDAPAERGDDQRDDPAGGTLLGRGLGAADLEREEQDEAALRGQPGATPATSVQVESVRNSAAPISSRHAAPRHATLRQREISLRDMIAEIWPFLAILIAALDMMVLVPDTAPWPVDQFGCGG